MLLDKTRANSYPIYALLLFTRDPLAGASCSYCARHKKSVNGVEWHDEKSRLLLSVPIIDYDGDFATNHRGVQQ